MDATTIDINNPAIFFDRELSWIDFNARVLEEAENPSNPILERLKFLAITESNLDEFYMVRVAGLRDKLFGGEQDDRGLNGMTAGEIMLELSNRVSLFVQKQYQILINNILPELKKSGIIIIQSVDELSTEDVEDITKYYKEEVSSILTPLAIDPSHPFPHILNRSLNLMITLYSDDGDNRSSFAVVQVPSVLKRFHALPSPDPQIRRFIPLEEIIKMHLSDLFYGMTVKEIHAFKLTRDSDLSIRETIEDDLLTSVKKEIKNRMWGEAVRLDLHSNAPENVKSTLKDILGLQGYEIFDIPNIINLSDLMFFYGLPDTGHLKFQFLVSRNLMSSSNLDKVFSMIRKGDILLHHPFDSFQAVEDLLKFASQDPKTLAIKMTLYRTSGDSPIIKYLQQAVENGKQVTVLVELKARFDEEKNIIWAQRLEDSGVHVVYGVIGLKIHCKLLLIVRRETDKIKRYAHLSTGNYNPTTAKFYTDISLFTNHSEITEDVVSLFNAITSFAKIPRLNYLSAAPFYLQEDIIKLINDEMINAQNGKEGRIFMKMNSLVDPEVIVALYNASTAGVKIDLVIRGICCLIPGIPKVSENIVVRSIVGRFLEHSRVYVFHSNGDSKIYLSSADCMPRNFFKRIEVMFPILDKENKKRIFKIIQTILKDNVKARILDSNGVYKILEPGNSPTIDSQIELYKI